ncbi:hypothetical protein [Acinetobacter sp. CFCC 10889]|uniref:hypothetical protein n=1 Tax=Acinetobacter sp. CFCC 10889 TaxID=1775557 RepID=UPI0013A6E20B|nr:hypothetical protein [Acinetobacter sp. CFCC 10889]
MNAILLNEHSRLMREMMMYAMKDSMAEKLQVGPVCQVFELGNAWLLHCSYLFF